MRPASFIDLLVGYTPVYLIIAALYSIKMFNNFILTKTTTKTLSSSYQTPFFIPSVCSNPNWRRSLCIWLFHSYLIATILIARSSRLSPPSPTTGWKATFPSLDVYLSGYIYRSPDSIQLWLFDAIKMSRNEVHFLKKGVILYFLFGLPYFI